MNWIIYCLTKKYASFNGRASRPEFWFFTLLIFIINIIFTILPKVINPEEMSVLFMIMSLLFLVVCLALLIPSLAVSARRLHDTNFSGWLLLLYFIPLLGMSVLLGLFCLPSTEGDNNYGPPAPASPGG